MFWGSEKDSRCSLKKSFFFLSKKQYGPSFFGKNGKPLWRTCPAGTPTVFRTSSSAMSLKQTRKQVRYFYWHEKTHRARGKQWWFWGEAYFLGGQYHTWYLSQPSQPVVVEKKNFMWRKFFHVTDCHVEKCLHMTNVQLEICLHMVNKEKNHVMWRNVK